MAKQLLPFGIALPDATGPRSGSGLSARLNISTLSTPSFASSSLYVTATLILCDGLRWLPHDDGGLFSW